MYPHIEPKLTIKKTISHPTQQDKVYGFEARNTMLGRAAVVLKEDAISRAGVHVPGKAHDFILENDGELVVLDGEDVLTMGPSDFAEENKLNTLKRGNGNVTMHTVQPSSGSFKYWDKDIVEITGW